MARQSRRWTLEDLIDFEQALASSASPPAVDRAAIAKASRGLDGAAARRAGLLAWLEQARPPAAAGKKAGSAFALVAAGAGIFSFLAGVSAVLGLLDPVRGGVNVTLFLAILIGGQWLVLALAFFGWLFRRKAGEGFSALQALTGKIVRRFAGAADSGWWRALMDSGGAARAALLWRLARLAQGAGIAFNLGIIAGLGGLVLLRHVGFFWETTTESAMRESLLSLTRLLSAPWSAWWPAAVPDASVIEASRWFPGGGRLEPGPAAWWRFLLAAAFIWGLLPRALLWLLAWRAGRSALARLDFQARHHRVLWRELTGIDRGDPDERPLDGVLVLDVGGSGLDPGALRPFLLRRLRVHPAGWHSVAVLDPRAEVAAAQALAKAPAGLVLLAEGWALSPARMTALHRHIRSAAGGATPVKFLVANIGPDRRPAPPTAEERREWERFVDSLQDPAAEVFFYEDGA